MDTAAVAIPIPVQPIEPQQPAAGVDPAVAADIGVPDFASALEQQLAQTAVVGANAAQLKLPGTDAELEAGNTPEARDAATPDGLIAMMTAPLFAPAAQAMPPAPTEARPADAGPATITAAQGKHGTALPAVVGRADTREQPIAAARPSPIEEATTADTQHAMQPMERDTAATTLVQPAEAPAPSALATLHGNAAPAPHSAMSAPERWEHRITARVGTAEWNDGLARQVTILVKDGEQTAQLRLDPPELGPLEVRLSMARDQDAVAHAQFVSPHAAVRDALEAALPQLRAVLADNGITLGQASVGEGFARDDARQPQQSGGNSGGQAHGGDKPGALAVPRAMVRHGLVDTFA